YAAAGAVPPVSESRSPPPGRREEPGADRSRGRDAVRASAVLVAGVVVVVGQGLLGLPVAVAVDRLGRGAQRRHPQAHAAAEASSGGGGPAYGSRLFPGGGAQGSRAQGDEQYQERGQQEGAGQSGVVGEETDRGRAEQRTEVADRRDRGQVPARPGRVVEIGRAHV